MTTARLAVVALCLLIALGSLGIGFASAGSDDEPGSELSGVDIRKDDGQGDQVAQGEPDPDDEPTGDGDRTRGNDGTSGGDNSYVAPAPAPVYGGGGDDGASYSGGSGGT